MYGVFFHLDSQAEVKMSTRLYVAVCFKKKIVQLRVAMCVAGLDSSYTPERKQADMAWHRGNKTSNQLDCQPTGYLTGFVVGMAFEDEDF